MRSHQDIIGDQNRELERLRAALGKKYREGYDNALAEQHVEIERLRARLSLAERSIQEFKADRADIIEECARVASQWCNDENVPGWSLIVAIRALKDKP